MTKIRLEDIEKITVRGSGGEKLFTSELFGASWNRTKGELTVDLARDTDVEVNKSIEIN